jgi:hypothetical protein
VDWVPVSALAPLQPPDAVQPIAFVELHVNVDEPPLAIVVGFAVSVTVGAGGGVPAVTVTDRLVSPPAPVQVSVKIEVADRAPVDSLPPAVPLGPLQASEAVQLVALAVLHVSVEALPTMTVVGFAASVTVGAGGTAPTVTVAVWLADPPPPVQSSVKPVVTDSDPVDTLPLVPLVPVQPPEAVQLVALVELHVSVEAPPLATDVGLADSVTVGAGGATVTSTVLLALPLEPEHVSV